MPRQSSVISRLQGVPEHKAEGASSFFLFRFFLDVNIFYFMCMSDLATGVSCVPHSYLLPTEIVRASDPLQLAYGCESTCGCWKQNSGLLPKQQVPLAAERAREEAISHPWGWS